MGSGHTIRCQRCSYSRQVMIGVGMAYGSIENVLSDFPPQMRQEIQQILQNHDVTHSDFGRKVFRCAHCNGLHVRLDVNLEYDAGQSYHAAYACPKCRQPLAPIDLEREIGTLPCPHCGQNSLEIEMTLLWD